ncbi:hypothetical protein GCM10023321_41300 [Pseudonocardia eucalypti]|uniref:Uncharacterized protein n=1 Tax=Pseudonocardia eucalypti TaxID=648755 RepID=A0ABP9QCS6_9PSEU|nr:hypothetical protein [Pseudonocardia eucalypti]
MACAGSLGKITVAGGVLCAVFAGVAPGVAMAQPAVAVHQAGQQGDGGGDDGVDNDWTTNLLGGGGGGQRSGGQQSVSELSDCDTLRCLREQAGKQQSSGSQGSHIAPGERNPSGRDVYKAVDDFIQKIMNFVKGIVGSSVPSHIPPVKLPKPTVPPMPLPHPIDH